jgi:hypothetical protein
MMVTLTKAQPNFAFYPFDNQFNASSYNPAFLTSPEKFTFSIFPVGGISIGYNDQSVIRNMGLKFLAGTTTDSDYKSVLNGMVDQHAFHQNSEILLLSFTYRSKVGFFNFRIKENQFFSVSAEGPLTRFIFKSDIRSVALDQIQYLPAQAIHFREYSLGYSFKSRMNRFSGGIRAKLYFGKSAFFSGISGVIQERSNDYALKTSGLVYISFPESKVVDPNETVSFASFNASKIKDYLMNSGNPGFGVDLGIKYKITPDLSFSASVIDLGRINWKTDINSKYFNGEFKFSGATIKASNEGGVKVISKTIDNYAYSDSISRLFNLTYERSAFSRQLPFTIYMGFKYQLNPDLSVSFTDRFISIKDLSYNSLAASANFNVSNKFSISSGYSIIGNAYFNIPLALYFKRNFGQIYIGTDNMASFLFPKLNQFAGISFGACFYLFAKNDLTGKTSGNFPFYRPRKIKKNPKTGLIIRPYSDY